MSIDSETGETTPRVRPMLHDRPRRQPQSAMTSMGTGITLSGISISPGLTAGDAFVFRDVFDLEPECDAIPSASVQQEQFRLEAAISEVRSDLKLSAERVEREFGSAMADIFRAHEEMLQDVALAHQIQAEIAKEQVSAERALLRVLGRWEQRFRSMQGETLRRRGDDVVDVLRRLLRSLAGVHDHSLERIPKGSILVARNLLPSDTTLMSFRTAGGVIVERGGPGSHCALLTRQMGIPGIAQVPRLLERISTGDPVLLDGLRGTVTVAPDDAARKGFRGQTARYRQTAAKARRHCHEPAVTKDGIAVSVVANIGNRQDAEMAVENGAEGVGLFRIEVYFLGRNMLPSGDELVNGLGAAIEPLRGMPAAIRLLDIGGDKKLPYIDFPSEPDPFLGLRGVRFLLRYPDLLDEQLRALLQLSQEHDIEIIVPMVTVADDMLRVRAALDRTAAEMGFDKKPPLGAMVETPAAALCAREIAAVSDSLNIGTNDLTQYTMAAGRENPLVNEYFRDDHPAVLKLLAHIIGAANERPVGICGELAGRSEMVEALLRTGLRTLSVPPPLLPFVKEAVRAASVDAAG